MSGPKKKPKNYCRFCDAEVHAVNSHPDNLKGIEFTMMQTNKDETQTEIKRTLCANCFAAIYNNFVQAMIVPGRLQQIGINMQQEQKIVTPEGAGKILGTDGRQIKPN